MTNNTSSYTGQIRLLFERVDTLLGLRPNARAKRALTVEDRADIILDARKLAVQEGAAAIPVGTILSFAADAAPSRWLRLDGAVISRDLYRGLWAHAQGSGILAATEGGKDAQQFGPGDGSTTFSLPDHSASELTHTVTCIRY